MRKFLFIVFMFLSLNVIAQRNNIWETGYFGLQSPGGGIINFSSAPPKTSFISNRPMIFLNQSTSICDSLGNLLFYTNGQYMANRRNDSLQNCKNFNPGNENNSYQAEPYSQSVIILPDPGNSEQYYVLGTSGDLVYARGFNQDLPTNFRYSIVNMSLDLGQGGVDSNYKAQIIVNDTLIDGHVTACKSGNGRDWWVIFHQYYSDLYYKILITPGGVVGPFLQHIGSLVDNWIVGQSSFTPNGSKYAFIQQLGSLDVFDFDRCSGEFSSPINIQVPIDTPYYFVYGFIGCAFSPSGKYLYVDDDKNLYQYDVTSSNVNATRQLVGNFYQGVNDTIDRDSNALFANMQLAPDNKIYMGTWNGTQYFHVINQPDSDGVKCDFKMYQLVLPDYNDDIPTYPYYNLGRSLGSSCDTLTEINSAQIKNDEFKITPNPTTGIGEIWINNQNYKPALLEIYNDVGEKVYTQIIDHWLGQQSFNIIWLPEGIYIIKVEIEGKEFIGKVVKE